MFSFWDEYITMVQALLQFVKAERTIDWHLHLASVAALMITPLCFSCITYLSFGTEIVRETKRKRQSVQPCIFLLNRQHRALDYRSSLYRLHRTRRTGISEDYRNYDADKS